MGTAIGALLPFAVGVMVSPMPVVAMVLMLITPQAKSNGTTFLLGWLVGVGGAGAILLAIAGPSDASDDGQPATWLNWVKLVLGLLLLLITVKEWRARPEPGAEVAMPKWMGMLSGITPIKSAGLAILLSAANPKNLLLIVGGAAAVAQTGVAGSDQAIAWAVFTIIAAIGVATPLVMYLALGDRAAAKLTKLKDWMSHNNAAIMAVLCLVIGAKLIGDAISGFSA